MKIYVGNLSFETTQASLQELFNQFGQVEEVAMVTDRDTGRPRGFAFVTMSDDGANQAIQDLNGKAFEGRSITVSEAKPREAGAGRGPRGGGGGGGNRRF